MRIFNVLSCLLLCVKAAAVAQPVSYDVSSLQWAIDEGALVSVHDTIYAKPPHEPWAAMPVGGGDLSAMVRCTGKTLILHLTKSDAWGFQEPADALAGSRFFNNVSPGTVTIALGDRAAELAKKGFRQRLDICRGRIVVVLGEGEEQVTVSIWGDPQGTVLLIAVDDPENLIPEVTASLSEWRDSMEVWTADGRIGAREIHERPARPHLRNTGMDGFFPEGNDPLEGRGTAVVVGATARASDPSVDAKTASIRFTFENEGPRLIGISCAVKPHGDPTADAKEALTALLGKPVDELDARRDGWWKDWWSKSFLSLSGDPMAERLCRAYHVHLYALACTNRGPVPSKWDGGPGLMRNDERTWGLAEWVQEIRFTYMPLYAANRLEMAKGLTNHYTQMGPYLKRQTQTMWGIDGLWIPETVLPWGHAEDWVLKADVPLVKSFLEWNPETAPYGEFERFNGYIGFLFTAGLEIAHHYLEYYDYSQDAGYLRDEAYPTVREICRFIAGLLKKGDDGLYHLDPANGLETWWLVRDPADTLDGIRAIFPRFVALSKQYGADTQLREKCEDILAHLPPPARAHWDASGNITPDENSYAPAAALGSVAGPRNAEIPALYRVYPFGLSGIGSTDRDTCIHTFQRRIFGITNSWSLDAVWATRLGLVDEAARLLGEHAEKYHRFPYGGWDSSNSDAWPGGLSNCPYVDGAGLSAFCLTEMLLQSHEQAIRVLPATPNSWSGAIRLRAKGGFLVSALFREGRPLFVEIESTGGTVLNVHHPWKGTDPATDENPPLVVRSGSESRTLAKPEDVLRFEMTPGEKVLLYEPGAF